MILVDTSVLIDYFRGNENHKTRLLSEVFERDIPFGLSAFTVQELLQGAKNDKEFRILDEYLLNQTIYYPENKYEAYGSAAKLFFDLRRKGITVRSSIDIHIAMTAIDYKLSLLHNDRDFDVIAGGIEKLRILNSL